MVNSKSSSGEQSATDEDAGTEAKSNKGRGLSNEAWVAIGAIAAALITGTVTLLTHILPQSSPLPSPQPTVSSTPIASSSSSRPSVSTTADLIAGNWAGLAKIDNGTPFRITLEIENSCALNKRCGSISVSHVPCYGEVFLENADDDEFEFRVDNFYGRSNRTVCQPGAGEHFKARADGKLDYWTSYEPRAQGTLERIEN
jgi:hypothetical protein